MRRFSLVIFALAVLSAVAGSSRKERTESPGANQRASDNPEGLKLVGALPRAAGKPSRGVSERSAALEQSDTTGTLLKTAAIVEEPGNASTQNAKQDYVTSAPAQIPTAAKAGNVDPALGDLAAADVTSAAQSELRRLGCYEAKVDGKWGHKSRAAWMRFSERAGGTWADIPQRETIAVLRTYPGDFCTAKCTPAPSGGQCVVALAPTAKSSGEGTNDAKEEKDTRGAKDGRDTSYLPPWMQGAKLTNAEPSDIGGPGAEKTLSDAAPVTPKLKKRKSGRRHDIRRERFARDYERPRQRGRDWLPRGWPGGRD